MEKDIDKLICAAMAGEELDTDKLIDLIVRLSDVVDVILHTNRELTRLLSDLRHERTELDRALSRQTSNLDVIAEHLHHAHREYTASERADRTERQIHDHYA